MYLWCSRCSHATAKASWIVKGYKYGTCPICGCSEFRNAVAWLTIAAANNYSVIPERSKIYESQPVLFNLD